MGIELEQDAINDTAAVLSQTGWTPGYHVTGEYRITEATTPKQDNLLTYLRVIRQAPGAISLEKKWTRGVPDNYAAAGAYLRERTGYSFPLLKPINQGRVVRAITTVLGDNLNKELTVVGLKTKMLAGYMFTKMVLNDELTSEVKNMAMHVAPLLDEETYRILDEMAWLDIPTNHLGCKELMTSLQQQLGLTEQEAAAMLLALAAAPSPAQVTDGVTETVLTLVEPAGIVEMIVWLSVLQLLHRLSSYYTLVKAF
jgi:transcription antitermination factor NusG